MVIDPVLVAAKTIARIQYRWMLVGGARQFIQPATRQCAEAIKMRLKLLKIIRLQIGLQQTAQAAIDRIKILSGAIQRQMIGAAIAILRIVERCGSGGRVHVLTSLMIV
jgi:hypothetical protein